MTPQQLVDDLQRRQALFDVAVSHTDSAPAPGMNPLVADALAGGPAPSGSPFLGAAKSVAPSVATPPVASVPPQDTAPVPGSPKPVMPAPQVDTPSSNSFYDMLLMNDAYRLQNKEAFERNEKANKARTTIAAISDALASLGNLVGTTQGAFNQPQTYQTPFVTEQVEADRARARQLADRLLANDQTIRLTQAREDMTNGAYALRQALEEERTRRAQMNNEARAALSAQNASQKSEQIAQQGGIRKEVAQMNNESAERRTGISAGTSAANNKRNIAFKEKELEAKKNGEIGGSGGSVGGYTTTTQYQYDELGHKTGETKTRTPAGGPTTTTTTTTQSGSSSSKTPPSRQQSVQGGSDKTPPSKKKKDNTKTPPSKRK